MSTKTVKDEVQGTDKVFIAEMVSITDIENAKGQ